VSPKDDEGSTFDNKIKQQNTLTEAKQDMNTHYQPQQHWYSMLQSGYGGFPKQHLAEGEGQFQEGHYSGGYHKYQEIRTETHNQIEDIEEHGTNKHNFDIEGNKYAQDRHGIHEGHNHNAHNHGSHGHKQQKHNHGNHEHHNHQTHSMITNDNTSLPLLQYPAFASSRQDWSVGSWISSLWPFNQHGEVEQNSLPEVGQDAASEVSKDHLVITP